MLIIEKESSGLSKLAGLIIELGKDVSILSWKRVSLRTALEAVPVRAAKGGAVP